MVVAEKHENKTEWWTSESGRVSCKLVGNVVYSHHKKARPGMFETDWGTFAMADWPDLRAAIDALHAIWLEQQEAK